MGATAALIDAGKFPGLEPGSFPKKFILDSVHTNYDGSYLVDLSWYAAFYHESPEGKVLPINTDLTAEQVAVLQKLAWDTVKNYPDCGLYEEGTTPVAPPIFSPGAQSLHDVQQVTLSSATPGAWFRYTLDGTVPTRTRGYVYCGIVSARPGTTVKAIAYKSGLADSPVAEAAYPAASDAANLAH